MNRKGQALIEFIIVFPIMIMILLAILDFANITKEKMTMESMMEDIILEDNPSVDSYYHLDVTTNDGKKVFKITTKINTLCPITSAILGTEYEVSVERVIHE